MSVELDVQGVVESQIKERFSGIKIKSVKVTPDEDADGDPILRVQVVFGGRRKTLDPKVTTNFLRQLRDVLYNKEEYAFPVISYIAASEIGKQKTVSS